KLAVDGPWQAIARTGLRDAALRVQRRLSERVLARSERGSAEARVSAWGVGRQGPGALAAYARGHACRGRRRLRHAHGRRRVGAPARGVTRVPGRLILVRHGQSAWNLENLFTGWTDVDLSDAGRAEAGQAGRELLGAGVAADVAFTSVLKRAIR